MKAERDAKRAYRDAHGDWIKAKADHETAKLAVEATKAQLLDDFHKWFADVQRETGFDDDGGDGDDDKLDDHSRTRGTSRTCPGSRSGRGRRPWRRSRAASGW